MVSLCTTCHVVLLPVGNHNMLFAWVPMATFQSGCGLHCVADAQQVKCRVGKVQAVLQQFVLLSSCVNMGLRFATGDTNTVW